MGKQNGKQKSVQHQHANGSSKTKATKDKKIIGKRVNKKQISSQVKDAVERTNSCNTELYAFYAQRNNAAASTMETSQLNTDATTTLSNNDRHRLIEQVTAAFNPERRDAGISMATDSLERVALLSGVVEQKK
ncbi:hypothetical protein BOX15_Mlig026499g2 [Macrostomum lignano]|uniref:Uncharacterized protein n=1 Tax=Macrostomum lignano TaxID=282301 RepID=A0A267G358_9PLAT|nr:hypothetical protein BOX15_Mlig026499g1 [Macrostomum lignano]PAA80515.1 hypothetical protein BOX15_Mlig026499g2 [Macrostomum lignano]